MRAVRMVRGSDAQALAVVTTFSMCLSVFACSRDQAADDVGFTRYAAQIAAAAGAAAPAVADPFALPRYAGAIMSFVASNAYHDYPSIEQKEDSKFEAFLLPTITPEEINQITVTGPDGFTFDIENKPFTNDLNGYLFNEREPTLWYQAIRATKLSDGQYTLRVAFMNGEQQEYSRVLRANDAMLAFYFEHKHEMQLRPSSGSVRADDVHLSWTTFRELGGPDAYYNAWISSGTGENIDEPNLRGDNVFLSALLDPNAGMNASSSQLSNAFDPMPAGPVTWQVEILDSNHLDGVNQIIFPAGTNLVVE
jgi:hypothetical protein